MQGIHGSNDVASEENNSVTPPCYHGSLAPSDLSLVLSPDNLVQSSDGSHSNANSEILFTPKLVTNFPTFKTAERKELSKVRRVPKRVMFSDDLENSQSSGRSSTMSSSFTDFNHVDLTHPHKYQRPSSIDLDLENSRLRHQPEDLRHSVDNLSYHDNKHSNKTLPGYSVLANKTNSQGQTKFADSSRKMLHFNQHRSYPLEFTKSLSSPDESTTTSGSYSLTLDEMSHSPRDEVFAKDLYV